MTKTTPETSAVSPPASPLYLLDVNVLIALTWGNHLHHALVHRWVERDVEHAGSLQWASCALTQLAFVRISSNARILPDAVSPRAACTMLQRLIAHPGHRYLSEAPALDDLSVWPTLGLVGHRQVTNGYLLSLAIHQGARLATLDTGLPMLLSDPSMRNSTVMVID